MGLWSWFKKTEAAGGTPSTRPSGPELVILLRDRRVVDARYLQQAIEHAFGVAPSIGDATATEFVTGENPLFHAQFGGRLLMVHYGLHPYFNPICAPFVSGDAAAIVRRAEQKRIEKEVQACRGWIAVTCLKAADRPDGEDPYEPVARLLWALAAVEDTIVAIIWPARGEIVPWDDAMLDQLEVLEYAAIFKPKARGDQA
jgi:hypothetical protein